MSLRHPHVGHLIAVLLAATGSPCLAQNDLWEYPALNMPLKLGAWPPDLDQLDEGRVVPHVLQPSAVGGRARCWTDSLLEASPAETIPLRCAPGLDCFDIQFHWRLGSNQPPPRRQPWVVEGLGLLGLGVGMHAALANSSLDQKFREEFLEHAAGERHSLGTLKTFGDTWIVVPTLISICAAGHLLDAHGALDTAWRRELDGWSGHCLRAFLVGGVQTGLLQLAIGASRPVESHSGWRPLEDDNGVSGHTTLGAIPFLVAAQRTANPVWKPALIAASGLAGYTRIYDDAHYLSQVLLGWWIAYLAVEATQLHPAAPLRCQIVSLHVQDVVGVGVEFRR